MPGFKPVFAALQEFLNILYNEITVVLDSRAGTMGRI